VLATLERQAPLDPPDLEERPEVWECQDNLDPVVVADKLENLVNLVSPDLTELMVPLVRLAQSDLMAHLDTPVRLAYLDNPDQVDIQAPTVVLEIRAHAAAQVPPDLPELLEQLDPTV